MWPDVLGNHTTVESASNLLWYKVYHYDDYILVVSTWVQQSKSVCTRGSKSCSKTSPQNCQKLENLLGNIEIFLARIPIFLTRNPIFLNSFLTFLNGFLLSSTAFCFPQRLSDFLNGFPLSKKSEKIYLRRQVSKRLLFELHIFCHLLSKLHNSRYNVYISPNTLLWCTCVPNSAPNLNWNIICPKYNQTAPISKSQNLTNALPCKDFIRKSAIILSVGHQTTLKSPLATRLAT